RVLEAPSLQQPHQPGLQFKSVIGGLLVQNADDGIVTEKDIQVVTKRVPSKQELADMLFAFRVCKHVKSNAIVFAKDRATIGIGAGQMSRVDAVRIASIKAADDKENPARASGGVV